ncbi:MAG: cytochrome C [Opitutae bacterium]|nr:cytochrome C [Opitutae bacterium]
MKPLCTIVAFTATLAFIPVGLFAEPETWWSRKPLAKPNPPSQNTWARNEVDRFILEKLKENDLRPSREASPLALIRRLTHDLTGLPPTPNEIEDFLAAYGKDSEKAYEALVDRLLASPRYGERFARHWLDVAKYADTCGYDKDKLRPNAWPYRDYVIRSFNEDKPYSLFVQEQVAGDALFPDESDGILGLGFLAAGPWDFIGHAEVPESKIDGKVARNLDRDDMVSNVFNTFCAVTIQCARCHEHKGDPITQDHYYSLQSVFAAIDKADRKYGADAKTEKKRSDLEKELTRLRAEKTKIQKQIKEQGGKALDKLDSQIKALQAKAKPISKRPEFGYHSKIEKSAYKPKWVQVDLGERVDIKKIILHACHDDHNSIGAGFGFPVGFKIISSNREDFSRSQVLADESKKDFANPGLIPVEYSVRSSARYLRISATKLALRSNDYIFALAELEVKDGTGKNRALKAKVSSLDSIEAPNRWRRTNLTDGIWAKGSDKAAAQEIAKLKKEKAALMAKLETPERLNRLAELEKAIKQVNGKIVKLPKGNMVYAAATHFKPQGNFKPTNGKPRNIRFLHRGDVTQPGKEVSPGTLPIFKNESWQFDLPKEHDESARRAALAKWLVRKDHPLTWRTIANRIWQWHFGQGLVLSPNDFGELGQTPSHPELLDWLALNFRDQGGSFKNMHKLLVMSSTYRQSSNGNEKFAKADSGNRLLWRMNRRKLSAEEIRDAILSVSGKLDLEMGGPGYYLFALEKTAHSPHYEYHKFNPEDAKSHRRSIYRFIVRSQPNPFMTTLDCADSSQSTPKRNETLTALQALSLLNNKFSISMARHFASRLEKETEDLAEQVKRGHLLVTGRVPTKEEGNLLMKYAGRHGLQNLCRALFNLSEFTYLD